MYMHLHSRTIITIFFFALCCAVACAGISLPLTVFSPSYCNSPSESFLEAATEGTAVASEWTPTLPCKDGVTIEYADHEQTAPLCERLLEIAELPTVALPCAVYEHNGRPITSEHQLRPGSMVLVFPADRPFQFLPIELGHITRTYARGVELETRSMHPPIFRVRNLLEAQHMMQFITLGPSSFQASGEGVQPFGSEANAPAKAQKGGRRTSTSYADISSAAALHLMHKAHEALSLGEYDEDLVDGIQVVRYERGQQYVSHHDFFELDQTDDFNWDPHNGGANRFATLFMYLKQVPKGGHTVFPHVHVQDYADVDKLQWGEEEDLVRQEWGENSDEARMIDTCRNSFSVGPVEGEAVLFYDQHPNGALDYRTKHGACPVLEGEKRGLNLWFWSGGRWHPSADSPDSVTLRLFNHLQEDVDVYWINGDQRVFQATLQPQGSTERLTYVGHIFGVAWHSDAPAGVSPTVSSKDVLAVIGIETDSTWHIDQSIFHTETHDEL